MVFDIGCQKTYKNFWLCLVFLLRLIKKHAKVLGFSGFSGFLQDLRFARLSKLRLNHEIPLKTRKPRKPNTFVLFLTSDVKKRTEVLGFSGISAKTYQKTYKSIRFLCFFWFSSRFAICTII